MRQGKQELELEWKRLTDSITRSEQSQSVMNAIGKRERESRAITDDLLEPAPGSLRANLEELREFAVSRLAKIRELLAHPEDIQKVHEVLAERVGQLTLEATNENGTLIHATLLENRQTDRCSHDRILHFASRQRRKHPRAGPGD